MKKLFILLSMLPALGYSQIDWKATAQYNIQTDIHQTLSFYAKNIPEANPIWSPLVRKNRSSELVAGMVLDSVLCFKYAERHDLMKWWAIYRMLLVWNNRKYVGYGMPVLVVRF